MAPPSRRRRRPHPHPAPGPPRPGKVSAPGNKPAGGPLKESARATIGSESRPPAAASASPKGATAARGPAPPAVIPVALCPMESDGLDRLGEAAVPRQAGLITGAVVRSERGQRVGLVQIPDPAARPVRAAPFENRVHGPASRLVRALHRRQVGVGANVVRGQNEIGDRGRRLRPQPPCVRVVDEQRLDVFARGPDWTDRPRCPDRGTRNADPRLAGRRRRRTLRLRFNWAQTSSAIS